MSKPRQKSIGVTPQEKAQLEKAKGLYQDRTGDNADWGKFLAVTSALALGALGIYKLRKSKRSNPVIDCPECGTKFVIAYPGDLPPAVYVQCPKCSEELVAEFQQQE